MPFGGRKVTDGVDSSLTFDVLARIAHLYGIITFVSDHADIGNGAWVPQ